MSKIIKNTTRNHFTEIIRQLKMEEAVHLLTQTDDSIEKISKHVGYSSSNNFA
ncbi:MAG: helix-turn-helix transcriptional regulator [Lachnospiraceae bacterium]|nr:helix-turn-helix transcriptional regulator [Lachnospiraceae bacterium]